MTHSHCFHSLSLSLSFFFSVFCLFDRARYVCYVQTKPVTSSFSVGPMHQCLRPWISSVLLLNLSIIMGDSFGQLRYTVKVPTFIFYKATCPIPAQSNATHDAHRWQREEDGSPLILFSFHQECEARCHYDWFNGTLNVIYNHSLTEWVMYVDCIEKVNWFYFKRRCSKTIFRSLFLSLLDLKLIAHQNKSQKYNHFKLYCNKIKCINRSNNNVKYVGKLLVVFFILNHINTLHYTK